MKKNEETLIAWLVLVAPFVISISFLLLLFVYVAYEEHSQTVIRQDAIDKCHEQDMAVIFDKSYYPICVSKDVLINNR